MMRASSVRAEASKACNQDGKVEGERCDGNINVDVGLQAKSIQQGGTILVQSSGAIFWGSTYGPSDFHASH